MTILFLTRLFHPRIGGVETHVKEVAKRLVEKGHRVIVVTETHGRSQKDIDGIKVIRLKQGKDNWFKKFRIWFWFLKHNELLIQTDVIHCHDVFFWMLPFRFLLPRKKIFTTFHGYETVFPPSKKAEFVRKISEKLSNGTIAVGDFIKKWYGTKPTYVTYGGVNKIQNSKIKIQNYNAKLKILFIGRLEEDTGVPIYLQVLEKLKEKHVAFEFTACGNGKLAQHARKYGKVTGFVLNIPWYIVQADIVFASSYLSILEALAYGKPVFAVYTNPLKKDYLMLSPFHKWITIAYSAETLAQEIVKTFKRRKMETNKKAKQWASGQSWDAVVALYEKLWKR